MWTARLRPALLTVAPTLLQDPIVSAVFGTLLAGAGLILVRRFAARPVTNGRLTLPAARLFGWLCALLGLAALYAGLALDFGDDQFVLFVVAALSGLLAVVNLLVGYGTQGHFDHRGVSLSTLGGRPRTGRWQDLRSVQSASNGNLTLRFGDGTEFTIKRLHAWAAGTPPTPGVTGVRFKPR